PIENASLVGEGLAGATIHSAARNGISRGHFPGRWTAPPLRTTSGLKQPESAVPPATSARPLEVGLGTAFPCAAVYRRISFTRLEQIPRCLTFAVGLAE